MSRIVSATEARVHLGELLDTIEEDEAISIEYASNVETMVVPASEAALLSRSSSARIPHWRQSLERARALMRADLGDRELPIDEIIHAMREERSAELCNALR